MDEIERKGPAYMIYVFVWAGLLLLTWLTVKLSGISLGKISLATPLAIASAKALLVIGYFMHLKYEKGLFRLIVAIGLITMAVVGWLVYSDIGYRNIRG